MSASMFLLPLLGLVILTLAAHIAVAREPFADLPPEPHGQ